MITVENLVKKFGSNVVLDEISFEVNKGEVLGFLGPNGAGKTTTMRILTGFLAPSDGKVTIDGQDVVENSLSIRHKIGYLPENNPLYDNMRIYEYLEFIAGMKSVPNHREAMSNVVAVCSLAEKISAPIAELSKGYRQRVGLAAALISDPDILLLDEPTSGLDPNQAREIRLLIREIGQSKTILFSTHIMHEVQTACDRAIIIHKGKIVGQGTVAELVAQAQGQSQVQVVIEGSPAEVQGTLEALAGVSAIEHIPVAEESAAGFTLTIHPDHDVRRDVFKICADRGWVLLEMQKTDLSLEDTFRELTSL